MPMILYIVHKHSKSVKTVVQRLYTRFAKMDELNIL